MKKINLIYALLSACIFYLGVPVQGSEFVSNAYYRDTRYLPSPSFFFGVEGGYLNFYRLPKFAYGEYRLALTPAITTGKENSSSGYIAATLGTLLFPNRCSRWFSTASASISGHYFDGKENSAFNLPSGPLAFNFIDGSSAFLGLSDVTGLLSRDYKFYGGDFNLIPFVFTPRCTRFSFNPYFQFGIHEFNQVYKIDFNGFSGADPLTLDFKETLKTLYYDLGGGFECAYSFLTSFSFFMKGGVYASYADTDFNGHETFRTGITTIPISISQHHHVWNSKVKAKTGFTFAYCNWLLEINGAYEYWGYTPRVLNPNFTDVGFAASKISNSSSALYSVGAQISYLF